MRETKITLQRIRNHFTYSWWKYVLLAVLAIGGWSLIYSSTAYRPPKDKRLDITFVTYALSSEFTDELKAQTLAQFPEVEDSTVMSITYTADDNYYGSMQLMTYTGAGEGDVYIMTRERFNVFAKQSLFEPLDEAIASGMIDLKGIDVSSTHMTTDEGVTGTMGVPIDALYGFMADGVDNRDMVIGVTGFSQNKEAAIRWVDWIIGEKMAPKPQWVEEWEAKNNPLTEGISDIPSY